MRRTHTARAGRIVFAIVALSTCLWPHSTTADQRACHLPNHVTISHDIVHPTEILLEHEGRNWRLGGPIRITARIQERNVLDTLELWEARDSDSNGVIDSHEWQQVGTAAIRERGRETIAVISNASVSVNADGYGLLVDMTNAGDSYCEFIGRVDVGSYPQTGGWKELGRD